jgi:putative nucleotidyltransferase with HDIG domain
MAERSILSTQYLASAAGRLADALRPEESTPTPVAETNAEPQPVRLASWAYVAAVAMVGFAFVAVYAPEITAHKWPGLVTLGLMAVVFERVGIRIYGETQISAGVVALFAIGIVYGPAGVAVSAPFVVLLAEAFTRSPWYDRLFDMSCYTITNVTTALVLTAFIDIDATIDAQWLAVATAVTLVAALTNYAVNTSLLVTALSIESRREWLTVWREKAQWFLPYFIVFGFLGLALALAYRALGVPGILAFVAPPLMMRFALHQYVDKTEQTVLELRMKNLQLETANKNIIEMTGQLTETYNGTLEALVLALDARDRETKGHSLRVAAYTMTIARQLRIEEGTTEWIDMQRGALLHDVGKIGVPDFILHKPGPLTPEEWDDMKRHPRIGFEMLRDISFLSGAASIVKAHHERFDGKGYPKGLMGDQIPLGARIFTIADAFDAMTSDRPYRKALTLDMAREEVVKHSGTQFDPQVVQAFLLVFDEIVEQGEFGRRLDEARAVA